MKPNTPDWAEYRCHHCKLVINSDGEPEQCVECKSTAFSRIASTERNPADVQDIVEALRLHAFDDCGERDLPTHVANIAADEIERLRAALQQSRSAVVKECVNSLAAIPTRTVDWGTERHAIAVLADAISAIRALSQESADAG